MSEIISFLADGVYMYEAPPPYGGIGPNPPQYAPVYHQQASAPPPSFQQQNGPSNLLSSLSMDGGGEYYWLYIVLSYLYVNFSTVCQFERS